MLNFAFYLSMDMLDRYHFRFCEAEVLDCSLLMLLVSFPEIIAGKKVDIFCTILRSCYFVHKRKLVNSYSLQNNLFFSPNS